MGIRLIATDIDGTLVRAGGHASPSPRVRAALETARARGLRVTLATGRMPVGARAHAGLMSSGTAGIYANGALLAYGEDAILEERGLDRALAQELWERGSALGLGVAVWNPGGLYLNRPDGPMRCYRGIYVTPRILTGPEELPESVTKLLWVGEAERIGAAENALRTEDSIDASFSRSEREYLEFVRRGVSKGEGLMRLAERLGLRREEIMAIGDEMNDLEMLRFAGIGVAMGGAPEALRREADFVTAPLEEDGLALAIERLALPEAEEC